MQDQDLTVTEKELAEGDGKIDAIKMYRNRVGCSLVEARDAITNHLARREAGASGIVRVQLNGMIESLSGYSNDDEHAEASVYSQTQALRVVMLRRDANRIRLGAKVRVTVEIDAEGK